MTPQTPKRKMLAIMATPEDLDDLRNIFEEMASNEDHPGYKIATKMMKAIHRCRKKHGFEWAA